MFSRPKPIPFFDPPTVALPTVLAPPDSVPGFDELFHGSPLPMWIFDLETSSFHDVNAAATKRYGWSHDEFLAMTADKVRPPEDVAQFHDYRRQMESIARSGLNTQDAWRHRTKDGTLLSVETAWQIIRFHGRKAALVTITDRSEQTRAEEENRELAHVLNLAADAIIVCNLNREVLFWNIGAEKIYGWSADEALGRNVQELFHLHSDDAIKCITELLDKGEWAGEMNHERKDGREVIVNSRWTLARDEDERKPKSILLINSDITETKKLESQFLRAQRLESIGTLASGIAHDLNNILSPIMMAVGIMRQSLGPAEQKMISIIEASAARGAGIVKQVLTFARGVEGERVLLQPKPLASEMTKVMQQTFPKNIDIQTDFPADLWMVTGDSTQLHQVLLNLCVNARDAMGERGGTLKVACEIMEVDEHLVRTNAGATRGPHVCFSVTDTGSGMTPEIMDKIFNPFFTTKEQGKGTGLGLATVIGIVKGHKGFLTIQSQVGVGTTFKVFIPADREAKSEAAQEITLEELRGNGELVLVVDDEAPIREAIVGTLESHNYRCYTAEDGTDALALYFERREIDVVITDLHMGMMDGLTLVRSLRKLNPEIKVIVSSGHIQKENQAALAAIGIKTVLEKPYPADKLLKSLKDLTQGAPTDV